MNFRLLFSALVLAVGAGGCSVIETEQRPAAGTATAPAPRPAAAVATVPVSAGPVWPLEAPSIYAQSAILIDAQSGQTLFQKNADVSRPVASTQKILTALLVVEHGSLADPVQITAADAGVEPTKLGVRPGQVYPRGELLTAMLVKSCNDAAAALARDVAGSPDAFAGMMNARAYELGATSTHFLNPHGLPAPQYSTARDMARIAMRVYRVPEIRERTRLPYYRFAFTDGRTRLLESTDKLLGRVPGVDGMKTGYTNAAGRCLITSATFGNRSFILVQLGSKSSYIFDDAARMMQWAALQRGGSLFASQ